MTNYEKIHATREDIVDEIMYNLKDSLCGYCIYAIAEKLTDGVAKDLAETADPDKWNGSDLRLAIGRVLCERLGIPL